MSRPPVLIENWLPIAEVGAESMRERGASSALPPLYFLHVWWARRPLIASRAAILASLLPSWSEDWPINLLRIFPTEDSYHKWFLQVIGIHGDPVAARKLIDSEKLSGIQTTKNKYGYQRAFSYSLSSEEKEILGYLFQFLWKDKKISVLDPFAGGGSIPFEATKYGFETYANDLNPVATIILKGTIEYPLIYGTQFTKEISFWGEKWCKLAYPKLSRFFSGSSVNNRNIYLWARTIPCPTSGKLIPLSPNWWIKNGDNENIAAKLIISEELGVPKFKIKKGKEIDFDPDNGTINRGNARSPWTGDVIDGNKIKSYAQNGQMGQVLYAIEVSTPNGRDYISPSEEDLLFADLAEKEVNQKKSIWISQGIIPSELFPDGNDNRPILYGMPTWSDFFSPRQLLVIATYLETLKELEIEIYKSYKDRDKANAIITYLSLALDKCAIYNCRTSRWHSGRGVMAPQFERHDFSFKWSHGEFNGSTNLLSWAISQIVDAYNGIAEIINPIQFELGSDKTSSQKIIHITKGSASEMEGIGDKSINNITVDPPYYDNVQYAELSDFFYVWLKRSVGDIYPEFFSDELTNKDDEAVANPARFAALGSKKKDLAKQDYERKMASAFREMYRVLHPDGVLTVMFTHKKVEAWDTLASALIGAGFTIKASWPVHTESEHSLHQAKKNAAASTIMLVCRKREIEEQEPVWWEDLQAEVRRVAREKAAEYVNLGITGADLYISTFGPTLSVISQHWPVLTSEVDPKTGQPKPLRPEIALDLAREEVVRLRKQGLLAGREVQFDPITDWYLMAWDAYAAEQFPYDEGRKLAIALGVDLDHDLMSIKRLALKKGEYIIMQTPVERRKTGMVDDELTSFTHWIDAAHTAMMIYSEDGAGACDLFLQKSGLKRDTTFKALLQTMINAIPRSRIKGKFVRPEAEVLENMRLAFFSDELTAPKEDEPELPQEKQLGFSFGGTDELDEDEKDAED